jgi:tRNA pseudouridine55 synthase
MLPVDHNGAGVLRRGQSLLLRGAAMPPEGLAWAACFGAPIAFGAVQDGYFVASRVFNLSGGGRR